MRLSYIILLSVFSTLANGQDIDNLKNEVEKILEFDYYLNFEEDEGLWIGVIDEDSTFFFSVGNISHDSLTNFQVGSISKLFTAEMAFASLKKENIIFTENITNRLELNAAFDQITIDQLFTHRSNLPKDPYFFGKHNNNPDNPYESYSDNIIISELNRYSHLYNPEKKNTFNYGHLNYALLGLMIENIEKQDYCELIKSNYSKDYPSIQCSDQADSLSIGFDKAGISGKPWSFAGFASSEGLSMNIVDLTNYMRTIFNKDSEFEPIKISKSLSFEAPWYVINQKRNKKVYSFSGTTSIHSVFVCLNKENQTAVVMMRNSGKGILHLPLTILSMVDDTKKNNK